MDVSRDGAVPAEGAAVAPAGTATVAAPNVDLAREISDQIMAVAMFQASVKVFTAASDMAKTHIDAKA